MFSTYVTILKNTFRIVKKEPIVLVPYMAFHIIITMAIPYINLTNKLWLFSILEWLIPCLIIQPIVILMAMAIIKNKEIKIDEIFIKCSKSFRALFLASLLYQPWYFLGAIKLSKFNLENAASMAGIPTNEVVFILTVLLIGVMMATAMIFFAPLYFAKNENNSMQLLSTIRQSFRLFYQFKWITIMFIIYFFLTFMIFKILVLQMVVFIAPNYLHDLFFHMFNAVERTVFYIFILRFYFYLRPLVNLSYN